jgi:hypothetical protein
MLPPPRPKVSEMAAEESVEDLLRAATVRVEGGRRPGAGFFVAPGLVLTCAHVVGDSSQLSIRWPLGGAEDASIPVSSVALLCDQGKPIPALDEAYPDVAVLSVALDRHPCVGLDEDSPVYGDRFQIYGFPEEGGSVVLTPAALSYRGKKAEEPTVFIDLASDTVKPGMSGAALLNLRSKPSAASSSPPAARPAPTAAWRCRGWFSSSGWASWARPTASFTARIGAGPKP